MQLRILPGALALFVLGGLTAIGCETHKAGKEERLAAPPPPKVAPNVDPDTGTTKDTVAAAGDEQPDPPGDVPPAVPAEKVPTDAVAVAAAVAGPSCEDAANNLLQIIAATVKAQSPEQLPMFEAQKDQVKTQFVGQCKADNWSAEARACVHKARSEADLQPCQDLLPNKQNGGPPPPPPAVPDTPPTVPSPPMADTPPAPTAPVDRGGPPCDQVARNVAALVKQVQDVPADQTPALLENITGMCTRSGWSRKVKECFAVAKRADELTECQRYANVEAQQQQR